MRGEANPAGGQRTPPSTDAEKQAAAQKFMQAARSGRMNMFGGGKKGLAQPQEGGQTVQPTGRNMMGSGALGRAAGQLFSRPEVQAQMKAQMKERGMKKGGSVSASKRADGCAAKGKTKGRMV